MCTAEHGVSSNLMHVLIVRLSVSVSSPMRFVSISKFSGHKWPIVYGGVHLHTWPKKVFPPVFVMPRVVKTALFTDGH